MNVNMQLIEKWIKKRKEQKLFEMRPIGSAIRLRRKALNMTLEEGAEGICSISYLSKIENNMIELSDQFIDKLLERFQMTLEPPMEDHVYKNHLKTLIRAMIEKELPDLKMLNHYQNKEDHQALLIRFLVYHLHQKEEMRSRAFDALKLFIPNLSHQELALAMIGLGSYFLASEKYQDAIHVLTLAPEESLLSVDLIMLMKRIRLIASMRMHRFVEVMDHMDPFMQQAMHLHYYAFMTEMKSEFYALCAMYADPKQMEEMMQAMSSLSSQEKDYVMALSYLASQQYDALFKITSTHKDLSPEWMTLHLRALDHLGDRDSLIREIASMNPSLPLSDGLRRIRTHLYYKHHPDKCETIGYLRREILGLRTLPDDHLILEFLMTDAAHMYTKFQHYKEATQVIQKFHIHQRSLKMAQFRSVSED